MVFQTWKSGTMEKKRKRKAILLLDYIADVSGLTNLPFYMRTLSLRKWFTHHTKWIESLKGYVPHNLAGFCLLWKESAKMNRIL